MKLFVIFVNFNSGAQLKEGVSKISKLKSVSKIVVVDNGSSDNSLKLVEKSFPKIEIIKNSENLGFYKAINKGIKKALDLGAEKIMPLDFDLDFSTDFISKLLKVDADVVAPVLKFRRNEKWIYDYGGKINWLIGRSSHIESFTLLSSNLENKYDFVSGGCTIFKKSVFKKIGLFDEDYFVYYGDTDYSLKASKSGFKVILDTKTIVHHKLEITKKTKNIRKLKIALKDNLTFINKWVLWYKKPFAYTYFIILSAKVLINFYR